MFTMQKYVNGKWERAGVEIYDLCEARHYAESKTETTGIPHRVVNERSAILFCADCRLDSPSPHSTQPKDVP